MVFDERDFACVMGSDCEKDGMFLELFPRSPGSTGLPILSAFYSDQTGQITVTAFKDDLPIEMFDWFTAQARARLPPMQPDHRPDAATSFVSFEQQVITWLTEFTGRRRSTIEPSTIINTGWRSLGIDGDEAAELLEHLCRESDISFETFPGDRYFGPERPRNLIGVLWRELRGNPAPRQPLTIRQLAEFMWSRRGSRPL